MRHANCDKGLLKYYLKFLENRFLSNLFLYGELADNIYEEFMMMMILFALQNKYRATEVNSISIA